MCKQGEANVQVNFITYYRLHFSFTGLIRRSARLHLDFPGILTGQLP